MYQNAINICIPRYRKICQFPLKQCWSQQKSRGMSRDSYIFLDLLWGRYTSAKFHHCRICVTDFKEGGLFVCPAHRWAAPKKPILNMINEKMGEHRIRKKNIWANFQHFQWMIWKQSKTNLFCWYKNTQQ